MSFNHFNPAYNCRLNHWSHSEFLQIAMFSARTRRRIARSSWNKPPSGHSLDWVGSDGLGQLDRTRWRYRVRLCQASTFFIPGWFFQTFFIFHFIYGMSSFPLTNSYFSRWLLHHQPDTLWWNVAMEHLPYYWVNYNDLTVLPHWKSWLVRGIIPKWP